MERLAVNPKRIRFIIEKEQGKGPIVYWMSRDQRAKDNWALLYAQELAMKQKSALGVIFCIVPEFLGAAIRQYRFMLRGLKELEQDLKERNIPFFLLSGIPDREIPLFLKEFNAGAIVTDFSPLRIGRRWREEVAGRINIPFYEVDAHNIVPCWNASVKQEYAAYTFRPKIHRLLPQFLEDFPSLKEHPIAWKDFPDNNWRAAEKSLRADTEVQEVDWLFPSESAALAQLEGFVASGLSHYDSDRNDPSKGGQSDISPYLHFGQISAQRAALEASASESRAKGFLEELIVRRELADNFCYYNPNYDSIQGFPDWSRKTLDEHRKDKREYLYSLKDFEQGRTHDDLWNAAQMEMVHRGKMHGYMRMYWAKKILEWTETPEHALKIAIHLNDKYELDGRDPNGYTGIAWSIGGVHDRAWKERAVFGKVRYMSYNGARRKFDVESYIQKVQAQQNQ